MQLPTVDLSDGNRDDLGARAFVSTHDLHRNPLFSDDALATLLDHCPREHLYALTMGHDDTRTTDNRSVVHDGVSGKALLRAVKRGRLWLNVTQVHLADGRYQVLVDQLFAQLKAHIPHFRPESTQATLLISSPNVLVYYHADALPSILWHLRGRKRIWVYPALDERYMRRDHLEDIYAGVRHEYLPFDRIYDQAAVVYDLQPGQWMSWPCNAPHRVTNLDSVSVSLSTEFSTRDSRARARIYRANRYLRTRFELRNLSVRESGAVAMLKTAVHRIAHKAGLDPLQLKQHTPVLRIDSDQPGGVVAIDGSASYIQP
jgi:hypothetical protein